MNLLFVPEAWKHYEYWIATDVKMLKRLNKVINDCVRNPYEGIGKPEPLKGNFSGCWSRRIKDEHRLVYLIENTNLIILQCRFHYDR